MKLGEKEGGVEESELVCSVERVTSRGRFVGETYSVYP